MIHKTPFALALIVLCALAALQAPARASGILLPIPFHPVRPDVLPSGPPVEPLEMRSLKIKTTITGSVARTHVDQVFFNPGDRVLEGTYLFTLPAGGSISGFSLYMDGRKVDGELMASDKAHNIYEGIVRQMRDPGLLEDLGHSLFSARIFPIPAHGERRIELEYQEVVTSEFGLFRYTYPARLPLSKMARVGEMVVTVDLDAGSPVKGVYCPTHEVSTSRAAETKARVGFEGKDVNLERDFTLYWAPASGDIGLSLMCHRPESDEPGYFLALIAPRASVPARELLPKDVVFVLDTSGSMVEQDRIGQAKKALKQCLQSLNKEDRFALFTFATDVNPYTDGFQEASDKAIEAAIHWVDKEVRAAGGTAIDDALAAALKLKALPGRPMTLCFITDGEPTVGDITEPAGILDHVAKINTSKARIFTLGIGADLNAQFLDQLAQQNGGTSDYVRTDENIELKVSNFYRKVASPVMTDLALDFGSVSVQEVYPHALGDLFAGSQLVVVGRYKSPGATKVVLSGQKMGQKVDFDYQTTFAEKTDANDCLPRLWATRKVGYLLDQIRLHGENEEVKEEVIKLAKKFGIVTPYTSYLVTDDSEIRRPPPPHPPFVLWREEMPAPGFAPGASGGGGMRMMDAGGASTARAQAMEPMAAPSPIQAFRKATGEDAVKESEAVRDYKDALTVEKTDASGRVKVVGRKTFTRTMGGWLDQDVTAQQPRVTVKAMSAAYFNVLKAFPELGQYLALGNNVSVSFHGKTLVVGDSGGAEEMSVEEARKALE